MIDTFKDFNLQLPLLVCNPLLGYKPFRILCPVFLAFLSNLK